MNLIPRTFKAARRAAQKGFTLIELAIVGLFLGLLAIFAISQFSGTATDATRSNAIFEASTKIADSWSLVAQSCGTGNDIGAVDLSAAKGATGSTTNNLSVILGTRAPHDDWKTCYNSAGVRPLNGVALGTAGAETVQSYAITATKGTSTTGTNTVDLHLAAVPESLILPLYNKYSSKAGAPTAALPLADANGTGDPVINFGGATNSKRDLTISKAL